MDAPAPATLLPQAGIAAQIGIPVRIPRPRARIRRPRAVHHQPPRGRDQRADQTHARQSPRPSRTAPRPRMRMGMLHEERQAGPPPLRHAGRHDTTRPRRNRRNLRRRHPGTRHLNRMDRPAHARLQHLNEKSKAITLVPICRMSAACLPRRVQNVIKCNYERQPRARIGRQYAGSPPAGTVQSAPGLPPRAHQAVNLRRIPRIEMLTAVRIVQVEHRHRRCSMAQRLGRSLRATSSTSAFTGCQEHEQTALCAHVSATRPERAKQYLTRCARGGAKNRCARKQMCGETDARRKQKGGTLNVPPYLCPRRGSNPGHAD